LNFFAIYPKFMAMTFSAVNYLGQDQGGVLGLADLNGSSGSIADLKP
jgi:hypothetical protein